MNPKKHIQLVFYVAISLKNRHLTHCMTIIGPSSETNLRFTIFPKHFSQVVFQSISTDSVAVMGKSFSFD